MVVGEVVDKGWMIWLLILYYYCMINNVGIVFSVLDGNYLLGMDDILCDVLVWVIYGFWLLILFMLIVMVVGLVIGIVVGVI